MKWKSRLIHWIEHVSRKPWYMPLVAALSALDAYIFVVPNEVLLIPAVLAHRGRWLATALWVSIGSSLGAASFALLASRYGESVVEYFFPKITQSHEWIRAARTIQRHGFWGLTAISLGPLPQHPAVALAGLVHIPMTEVFLAVLIGRTIKYVGLSWCAIHAPRLLMRVGIWPKSENS